MERPDVDRNIELILLLNHTQPSENKVHRRQERFEIKGQVNIHFLEVPEWIKRKSNHIGQYQGRINERKYSFIRRLMFGFRNLDSIIFQILSIR